MNKKNQIGKVFGSMWVPRGTRCSLHERLCTRLRFNSPNRETSEDWVNEELVVLTGQREAFKIRLKLIQHKPIIGQREGKSG